MSSNTASRPAAAARPAARSAPRPPSRPGSRFAKKDKAPDPILFQTYFKSVGPRTYAAQMKRASNGNQYLVFTEGKRDRETNEVRKTSLFVFSEDFAAFFKMLKETAEHIKANPVPAAVAQKQAAYWKRQQARQATSAPAPRSRDA